MRYQALLGEPFVSAPAVVAGLGLQTAAIYLRGSRITLIAPAHTSAAGSAAQEHLAVRGEGLYPVAFSAAPGRRTGPLDPLYAHGARLELVSQSRTPSLT